VGDVVSGPNDKQQDQNRDRTTGTGRTTIVITTMVICRRWLYCTSAITHSVTQ